MKKIIFILGSLSIIFPSILFAEGRDFVGDWYFRDFKSEITVNTDSTITVKETIAADCGNLAYKHGIYRTLPEFYYFEEKKIPARVELISIKNPEGNDIKYSTTRNSFDDTITWKIGDPKKEVKYLNYYIINYRIKNVIRHGSKDELYWNLNGNFWDLETDHFEAIVSFPSDINKSNTELNLYSGIYGEKDSEIADFRMEGNVVTVESKRTLKAKEGITLSAVFPDGIVEPYIPSFMDQYGLLFWYLIPILVTIFSILLWRRYGRDPKGNPTIVPEFEIPEKLPPMELGMIYSDGTLKNNYISAGIIGLAVNEHLKIEEIAKKGVFGKTDYKLIRLESKNSLSYSERSLIDKIFSSDKEKLISDLKNKFYLEIPKLSSEILNKQSEAKLLFKYSKTNQIIFVTLGVFCLVGSFFLYMFTIHLGISLLLTGLILGAFSFLMKRRTSEGLQMYRRIQGLKLYMDTAEKYRQQFNEKENIFEKFLPYAIMFGMTKQWINKMKDIYGEKYFANYRPAWFYGYAFASFNVDNLNSAISDMSSNIATTMASSPSSSGAGGGGFSGGGGGGGGGGGW